MTNLCRRTSFPGLMLTVLLGSLISAPALAQEEDEDTFRPGLVGRYRDAAGRTVVRVDRTVGFAWLGQAPDPRLSPGRFGVQWRGFLMSQANGAYQLHVYVAGRVRVQLGGNTVLQAESMQSGWHSSQPIQLSFDHHAIQIDYETLSDNARIGLYWSGPQFQLEPVDGRQLFHDRRETPDSLFERGEQLVAALRCAACHELPGGQTAQLAPALDHLDGNLRPEWLERRLTELSLAPTVGEGQGEGTTRGGQTEIPRRMPHIPLSQEEVRAVSAFLFAHSLPKAALPVRPPEERKSDRNNNRTKKKKKGDEPESPPKTPLAAGEELVFSLGCLACHRVGELGTAGLFDGGDLSLVASKRPEDFFVRWLAAPETINSRHRMPVFELTDEERRHIATFLATLDSRSNPSSDKRTPDRSPRDENLIELGGKLFDERRCRACHVGPNPKGIAPEAIQKSRLSTDSNWQRSCVGVGTPRSDRSSQPQYPLSAADQLAVREYLSGVNPAGQVTEGLSTFLVRQNCLGCHARAGSSGLAAQLGRVAQQVPDLAPLVPALTPPPLDSVGDKLHDSGLRDAIRRSGPPHRPYLQIRMPRFPLTDEVLQPIVDQFIIADRIPDGAPLGASVHANRADESNGAGNGHRLLLDAVGSRLVTADGFGCTSCHQVGSVLPVKVPLNARGPDLSLMGKRIRRSWYDRWVRNPARIVPRMEMPSVQVAVRGVLDDDLDSQLAAVWEVLNRPGFEPPAPNPVRTVRHSGANPEDPAFVVTDVVRAKQATFIKPLLVGFSNRHNVLFNLESARLSGWSMGDVARQRTEGKSWYWESAGKDLFLSAAPVSELALEVGGQERNPRIDGQFATEFDVLELVGNGVRFQYRLRFEIAGQGTKQLLVTEQLAPLPESTVIPAAGFRRTVEVSGAAAGQRLVFRPAGYESERTGPVAADGKSLRLGETRQGMIGVRLTAPADHRFQPDGSLRLAAAAADQTLRWEVEYFTDLLVDRFPVVAPAPVAIQPATLEVVPGFDAVRLPLSDEIMPTGLAWRPDGTLVIASLKGQVWLAHDVNGDGLAEQLRPFSIDLAAPYGVYAASEYIDVINKYALLRLYDDDGDGRAERTVTLASGWGHTADYHDWAVGLPRDESDNYYVGLPCQQDDRSRAAAHWRGAFLRLAPRMPTRDDPRRYSIEPISLGHRFPMGIALHAQGDLFVTDNQGNYNPFNELNHIRQGAHFGFINALEKGDGSRPELTPPAIDIPHPWTRSVNGICFLDTPPAVRQHLGRSAFGPLEGHLIGCEMDTRRLVRMTLQRVDDTYQGAAYPFSLDQPHVGPPLLGPIVCGVSPSGDLFVGGLRDSGWGGANNVGEIVRLRYLPPDVKSPTEVERLPNGIVEMRATSSGFTIDFVAPVSTSRAMDPANYSLSSYTRESTTAYGGPDLNHRTEKISGVTLSTDACRVSLQMADLRPGYVYELHVKNLTAGDPSFFPSEAHYTLRKIPR